MLKKIMSAAFKEAQDGIDPNRPTLFILRGFSEVISKIDVPDEIEAFDMNDLEGNDPRFILAEMFQVLSVDEEIYDEISEYSYYHPDMAIANIHQDQNLSLLLFSIAYLFEERDESTEIIKEMKALNYNFINIDFNLYEFLEMFGSDDYFPINHQPVLHSDMQIYDDLEYPGIFNSKAHQIGIVNYLEKLDLDTKTVKVFKNDKFIKNLNIDYDEKDVYQEASDAFFQYFSVFDRLH